MLSCLKTRQIVPHSSCVGSHSTGSTKESYFLHVPPTPVLCLYFVLNEDVLMGEKCCGVDFDDPIADGHP